MRKMTSIRTVTPFLVLMLMAAPPVLADNEIDVTDVIKESFSVNPGGTLYMELDYGNIEIVRGGNSEVRIEMERTVRVRSEAEAEEILERHHEYEFEKDGDDVTIESRYIGRNGGRWGDWDKRNRFKITVRIWVPEEYDVDFDTGAGNIEIDDLNGEITGRTGAGNITIGEVAGEIDITSGAGNVTIDGAEDRVEVRTGAGNIKIKNVMGDVRAGSGAGNVTAWMRSQTDGDSELETGAGNVTVYLAEEVGVYVTANASMGSASCEYDLEVKGKFMNKSFEGDVNGGGPDLRMSAGVGNVTLKRD